jgi:7-carboxy-7-deazaguanine synthase (Cx14CxxC type)
VYQVKELFYTLQGEGMNAGRPAVFCRFAGCNLWSGREPDRASAICKFCDTDFVGTDGAQGGGYASATALTAAIARLWPTGESRRKLVVLTGGEPALQLDTALLDALHAYGFQVAIETNGTLALPAGIDWVCVSPKANTELRIREGDELKLVFPQDGLDPASCEALEFAHFLLQPMDGPAARHNTELAVAYCMAHPKWRLSLQTHKMIGIR